MKTKNITLILITILFGTTLSFAQTLEGRLGVKGFSRTSTFKDLAAVDLFQDFKEGTYSINFNFKANSINNRNIVLFDMKTTVKYNGKTISQTTRVGWPWLPGDMFVPAEGFDFIPVLEKLCAQGTPTVGFLPKGKYEIMLEMVPTPKQLVRAGIAPTTIKFSVQ